MTAAYRDGSYYEQFDEEYAKELEDEIGAAALMDALTALD